MAVQSDFGRLSVYEDFIGHVVTTTISDATAVRYNDLTLIAISGDTDMASTVDESGGVMSFTGAGAAADGIAITAGMVVVPSSNGPITMEARFKAGSATDFRAFVGWQETMSLTETVNPFTLSGTTLTSNDGGNVFGFYTDAGATTDDFRLHASLDGTELTTAGVTVGPLVKGLTGQATTTLGALGVRCGVTLTADSWYIARVVINPDGSAEGWFGHSTMANSLGLTLIGRVPAGTLDKDALYYPHLHLAATSTGDPLLEVDYFHAKGSRDWAA